MINLENHLISKNSTLREALKKLNKLALDSILFVVDDHDCLLGSLTDGDVRRGILSGKSTDDLVIDYIQQNPKSIYKDSYEINDVIKFRNNNFRIIPVLDNQKKIVNILNFRIQKSYLPLDAVIMAGGRGSRLSPLTDITPKPLLKVADKSIIDYNVERLMNFGIDDFFISLHYKGNMIKEHFTEKNHSNIKLKFIEENEPLGTIGAVSLIDNFFHEDVLITNSDILTEIDYEDFYLHHLRSKADMTVASIPYSVSLPYAVLETTDNKIISFKEKPKYTYYSNAGIYIIKREILKNIQSNQFYNATDLMKKIIDDKKNLVTYPFYQYWLDIGKPEDFEKAKNDIKNLRF